MTLTVTQALSQTATNPCETPPLNDASNPISLCLATSVERKFWSVVWKEMVKCMGVRVNQRLCFNAHVSEVFSKSRSVQSSNNSRSVRAKLFIRSVLTCASPAWWLLLATSNKCNLEEFRSNPSVLVGVSVFSHKLCTSRSLSSQSICFCPAAGWNSFRCFLPKPQDH